MVSGSNSDEGSWPLIEAVFHDALAIEPEVREAFLSKSCADRPEALARVRELLQAHDRSDGFMEPPREALAGQPQADPPEGEHRRRLGAFQTVRVLAAGGMGTVYEAVQDEPRRTVALKLLRAGTSSSALRRFRQEVALLAHLRHPGIAQIYEAGTVDDAGAPTPYFAMEYLAEGKNLLDFANGVGLGIRERLGLFTEVCHAVHYGHQRGVIHRDLKPSNILVDASGRPKIIDFGVARATDLDLAVTTGHTHSGQLIGTPAYMSPEQGAAVPHEIDTRSDVYSLGVVAYELLCGTLPYHLSGKPLPEAIRIIQHEPPRKPSTLKPELRGDLETILLKALAKEPQRRYGSVAELALDIRKYLRHEPIEARPPSATYQLRLFARRHRTLVGATLSISFALICAVAVSTGFAMRAARAVNRETEARTRVSRLNQFLEGMLTSLDARRRDKPVVTVRQMLDEAAGRMDDDLGTLPEIDAQVRTRIGLAYQTLGLYDEAQRHLQIALEVRRQSLGEEHPDTALSRSNLGMLAIDMGDYKRAHKLLAEYVDALERRAAAQDGAYVQALNNLAVSLCNLGRYAEARPICATALGLARELHGPEHRDVASCLDTRGWIHMGQGRYDEAEQAYRDSLTMSRHLWGDEHLQVATTAANFGELLQRKGDFKAAEGLFLESLAVQQKLLGPDHPDVAATLVGMAHVQEQRGEYARAAESIRKALEIQKRLYGRNHAYVAYTLAGLGVVLQHLGDYVGAEAAFRESLAVRRNIFGDDDPITAHGMSNLSALLEKIGRLDEAESLLVGAIPILRHGLGAAHPNTIAAVLHLATIKFRRRELDTAEKLFLQILRTQQGVLDDAHPGVLAALGNLAAVYCAKGEPDKAEVRLRDALARVRGLYDDSHPWVLRRRADLAKTLHEQGRLQEALALYRDVVVRQRRLLPSEHPDLATGLLGLAAILIDQESYAEAETYAREAYEIRRQTLSEKHEQTANAALILALCLIGRNDLVAAETLLRVAYPVLRDRLGGEEAATQSALRRLVDLYEALGRPAAAEEYRARLLERPE